MAPRTWNQDPETQGPRDPGPGFVFASVPSNVVKDDEDDVLLLPYVDAHGSDKECYNGFQSYTVGRTDKRRRLPRYPPPPEERFRVKERKIGGSE